MDRNIIWNLEFKIKATDTYGQQIDNFNQGQIINKFESILRVDKVCIVVRLGKVFLYTHSCSLGIRTIQMSWTRKKSLMLHHHSSILKVTN